MISGTKFFSGFLFFLCLLCCCGENFNAVSDDDAGRLLYWSGSGRNAILVFQKRVADTNALPKWQCNFFRDNGSISVYPNNCHLLNYTEAELTPEIVAMELAYWTCANANGIHAHSYWLIAAKMNSPVTNKLLFFYNDLNEHYRSALRAIDKYKTAVRAEKANKQKQSTPVFRQTCPKSTSNTSNSSNAQSSVADLLEESLEDSLKSTVAVKRIQDECDTENNYFLAFCMYLKYRTVILQLRRLVSLPEIQKDLAEDIHKLGEDVREKYLQGRARNQNRENSFRSVCRGTHGPWEWAPPTDLNAMLKFVNSCYRAWQKTHSLSPYSEFPEWGNAMLEVLQMIQSPALEQKFDTAWAEYQKYNN